MIKWQEGFQMVVQWYIVPNASHECHIAAAFESFSTKGWALLGFHREDLSLPVRIEHSVIKGPRRLERPDCAPGVCDSFRLATKRRGSSILDQ